MAEESKPEGRAAGCLHCCADHLKERPICPTKEDLCGAEGEDRPVCINKPCGRNEQDSKRTPLLDCAGAAGCDLCCGQPDRSHGVNKNSNGVSHLNNRQQWSCICLSFLGIYFVLGGVLQFLCFHFATMSCGSLPDDYPFPGGGHGEYGGPEVQLIPRRSLVVEREAAWYGAGFDVYNATSQGTMAGAPVGTWFRTWGPWFSTYTYQDIQNSKSTIYMRSSIPGMFLYNENWVMRCDGKGIPVRMTEGSNFFGNRIRHALGMNQGMTFKVFRGGEEIATAEETFHGAKSITLRNITARNAPEFASSFLQGNKFDNGDGQQFNQWLSKNDWSSSVPFYETNALCTLYAFRIYNLGIARSRKSHAQKPQFLELSSEGQDDANNEGIEDQAEGNEQLKE